MVLRVGYDDMHIVMHIGVYDALFVTLWSYFRHPKPKIH